MLETFWKWFGITPQQYASNFDFVALTGGKEPFDYPQYPTLIQYAKDIINSFVISDEQMDDLLTILALDNEDEDILDYIVDHLPPKHFHLFIVMGLVHLQPHARWQLTEFIVRRKPKNAKEYLEKLCNDLDDYVRRRAFNAMNLIEKNTGDSSVCPTKN